MATKEQAVRRAELLVPKLEHLKATVGGGRIHDVQQHAATVGGFLWLVNHHGRLDPEQVAQDLLACCDAAEKFLAQIARER